MVADLVQAIFGNHSAVPQVVLAAPVEPVDPELEPTVPARHLLQGLDSGADHLGPDAIARNRCDSVGLHLKLVPPGVRGFAGSEHRVLVATSVGRFPLPSVVL